MVAQSGSSQHREDSQPQPRCCQWRGWESSGVGEWGEVSFGREKDRGRERGREGKKKAKNPPEHPPPPQGSPLARRGLQRRSWFSQPIMRLLWRRWQILRREWKHSVPPPTNGTPPLRTRCEEGQPQPSAALPHWHPVPHWTGHPLFKDDVPSLVRIIASSDMVLEGHWRGVGRALGEDEIGNW